ncbi:unnamed protein product [Phyllotreta striolata]|uniref:Major facilitator superfamily (MFS) profile domain-containing protein n=1 Tax=Phyllotreta striolata TaxID=444603 RepID=A0A9N9U0Z0_PHYSR|nr:unnamed protein product [Phyllotreta striolata]
MTRRGSTTIAGELVTFEQTRRTSQTSKDPEDVKEAEANEELKRLNDEESTAPTNNGPKFGKRHIQIFSYCFLLFINLCMRLHISLTVLAMIDSANPNKNVPTFNWTNKNVILSSFFWGYIAPQIITGWLATQYGPKWFVIGSTCVTSFIEFLIPTLAVHFGSTAVIVCRMLQGFSQSFLVPSLGCVFSRWVPVSERARAGALMAACTPMATIISMSVAGPLAASSYGWPLNFYTFGCVAVVWSAIGVFFNYSSPSSHPNISQLERTFIIKTTVNTDGPQRKTPWGRILTSAPLWSLKYSYTSYVLLTWMLLTQIPSYLGKVLQFNIATNGYMTSFIFFFQWMFAGLMSILSDYLTNNNYLRITAARKIFTAIGLGVPAVAMIFLAQCTKDSSTMAVTWLLVSVGAEGACMCSLVINALEIAPNFAGILQGFINGFSHVFALLAPLLVDIFVKDENDPEEWKKIFYLISGVAFSGALVFVAFSTAEPLPWNDEEEKKDGIKS